MPKGDKKRAIVDLIHQGERNVGVLAERSGGSRWYARQLLAELGVVPFSQRNRPKRRRFDRHEIECYLRMGKGPTEIARLIEANRSSVHRWLRKNMVASPQGVALAGRVETRSAPICHSPPDRSGPQLRRGPR